MRKPSSAWMHWIGNIGPNKWSVHALANPGEQGSRPIARTWTVTGDSATLRADLWYVMMLWTGNRFAATIRLHARLREFKLKDGRNHERIH
jgi:hypothetical protein